MHAISLYSEKPSVREAVDNIRQQCGNFKPEVMLYFASSNYNPAELCSAMQDAFSGATVFGCTTAGEITSGRLLKNSVVVMGLDKSIIADVKVCVVEDVSDLDGIKKAFAVFGEHFGTPMAELDFQQYVGIILIDGLSGAEERVMDRIGDLTNIPFIGGSAGDDLKFAETCVASGAKAYSNAAVLAVIKPSAQFSIIKTQSFRMLDTVLVPTKVNEARREVIEFNGKPAAAAYAEAIGTTVERLPEHFMHNPVGLVTGDDFFVRSPQQVQGESVIFYCNVKEGMELALLESTDMIADTKDAVKRAVRESGGASALINFHCILRTLELEQKGLTDAYGGIFSGVPTIGFSTYGEEYIGHINQTSTILLLQ